MKFAKLFVFLTLSVATGACLDEMGSGPTPLVNTQLAQLQAQIEELEHQLAVCYAGHELERGEEDKYLPPRPRRSDSQQR
jgi:hypothetical protein